MCIGGGCGRIIARGSLSPRSPELHASHQETRGRDDGKQEQGNEYLADTKSGFHIIIINHRWRERECLA